MFPVSSSLPRLYSLWYRNLSLQSDDFFLYECALLLTAPLIISAAQDQGYGLLFWLMKSCNSHLVAVYFFLSFPPPPSTPPRNLEVTLQAIWVELGRFRKFARNHFWNVSSVNHSFRNQHTCLGCNQFHR